MIPPGRPKIGALLPLALLPLPVLSGCVEQRVITPEEPLPAVLAVDRPTVQLFRLARGRMVTADTVRISNNGEGRLGPVQQIGGVDYQEGRVGWLRTRIVNVDENHALLILEPTYADEEQDRPDRAEVVLKGAGSPELRRVAVLARTLRGAEFEFSISPLVFAAVPGDPVSSQSLTVRNGGNGSLVIHPPTVHHREMPGGWLSVERVGGGDAAPVFEVRADPEGLPGGLFSAELRFESGADEETRARPAAVEVQLSISRPLLGVSTGAVGFTVVRGEPAPPPQVVSLSNAGAGAFQALGEVRLGPVSYGAGAEGWLDAVLLTGGRVELGVAADGIPVGAYAATLPVLSDGGGARSLQVSLVVEAPVLTASSRTLSFGMVQGSGVLPEPRTLRWANTGSGGAGALGRVTVEPLTQTVPWLALTPGDGVEVAVTTPALSLAAGSYATALRVGSEFGGSDTVAVNLVVSRGVDGAVLALSADQVDFQGYRGGPAPPPATVVASNAGGGTLGALSLGSVGYTGTGGWLTASLVDSTITLAASTGTLAPGSYAATLPVNSTNGGTASIQVAFSVTAPVLTASSLFAAFGGVAGGSGGETRVLTLSNTGSGSFADLGTVTVGPVTHVGGGSWLTAALVGTELTLTLGGLPGTPGSYTATVPVTSTHGGSLTVTVTLTVVEVGQPLLALSVDELRLGGVEGGEDPSPVAVVVSNAGAGGLAELGGVSTGPVTYGPGAAGWLSTGAAEGLVTVEASLAGLAEGSYTAQVPVNSGAGGSAGVAVTLEVAAGGSAAALGVSSTTVELTAVAGGAPDPVGVVVFNAGDGGLAALGELTAGPAAYGAGPTGWLTVGPPAGGVTTLAVSSSGLPPGSWSATVPIASEHGGAVDVAVTLQLMEPVLAASSEAVVFGVPAGGPPSPAQSVELLNTGAGVFADLGSITVASVTYTGAGGWLTSPAAGSAVAGTSVGFSVAPGGVPPGTHAATVTLASSRGGSRSIEVNLSVAPQAEPPLLVLSTGSLRFGALLGGGGPSPRSVTASNGGGGVLGPVSVGTPVYGAGPGGWATPSVSGTSVSVSVSPAGLPAGEYTASIPVSAAPGGTRSLEVTLVVGAPRLTVSPATVSFGDTVGGVGPLLASVSLANTGGGDLASLGALSLGAVEYGDGASGWLQASLQGTQLTLAADPRGLSPRPVPWEARVPVASEHGGTDAVSVAFSLSQGAAPPRLILSMDSLVFTVLRGAPPPPPQRVDAFNGGGGSLGGLSVRAVEYLGEARDWLQVTVEPASLSLTPRVADLAPGIHRAVIRVGSDGGGERSLGVTADLSTPVLALSTRAVNFSDTVASPDTLRSRVFISNVGGGGRESLGSVRLGTPTWSGGAEGWLRTLPVPGSEVAGFSLEVEASTAALPEGSFTAALPLVSDWGGADTVRVTLAARRPDRSFDLPSIELVRDTVVGEETRTLPLPGDSVVVTVPVGAAPGQVALRLGVRNASETRVALSGLRVGTPTYPSGGGGWVSGAFLDRTSATFSRPAELFIALETGGLTPGRREARLVVASEAVGLEAVPPRTLRVILVVP